MKFHQLALAAAMAAVTAGASANIVRGNNADILLVVYSPTTESSFVLDTGLGSTTFKNAALNGSFSTATFNMPALFTSSSLATAPDAKWALIGYDGQGDLAPDAELTDNISLISTVDRTSAFTPAAPGTTADQLQNIEAGQQTFAGLNNFLAQNQPSFAAFSTHLTQTNGFSLATKADNGGAYFLSALVGGSNFGGNFAYSNSNPVGAVSAKLYRFSSADLFDTSLPAVTETLADARFNGTALTITVVPEPSTYALLAAGLALVGFVANRRRQA